MKKTIWKRKLLGIGMVIMLCGMLMGCGESSAGIVQDPVRMDLQQYNLSMEPIRHEYNAVIADFNVINKETSRDQILKDLNKKVIKKLKKIEKKGKQIHATQPQIVHLKETFLSAIKDYRISIIRYRNAIKDFDRLSLVSAMKKVKTARSEIDDYNSQVASLAAKYNLTITDDK